MNKDDSKGSAGTNADSEQNDQDLSVSQHIAKPNVVGSQCHGAEEDDDKYFGVLTPDVHEYLLSLGFSAEKRGRYNKKEKYSTYMLSVSPKNGVSRLEELVVLPDGTHFLRDLFRGYISRKLEEVKILVGENCFFNPAASYFKEDKATRLSKQPTL